MVIPVQNLKYITSKFTAYVRTQRRQLLAGCCAVEIVIYTTVYTRPLLILVIYIRY